MFGRNIKELSVLYNVNENIVIDALKESIQEVLTQDLGHKVNAEILNNTVALTLEVNQHGNLTYQQLSESRIKSCHLEEITKLLNFKLHYNEARELYNKYSYLSGKSVQGKILKKLDNSYLIKLELDNDNLIAICYKDFILQDDIKSKDSKYFQVVQVSVIREENIYRLLIVLTRLSKKLPVLILENLDHQNKSKNIKCIVRKSGNVSVLTSDSKISKESLQRLQSEFYGEYFKIIIRKNEINNVIPILKTEVGDNNA